MVTIFMPLLNAYLKANPFYVPPNIAPYIPNPVRKRKK